MKWALIFTASYHKRELRFFKRHPEIRQQYLKTLQLLESNPFHPSLRLHPLKGKLSGLHSVSQVMGTLCHCADALCIIAITLPVFSSCLEVTQLIA